nr:hypothetical protein Iba_scaffold2661CG0360 [Ipomoea batatas]
MTEEPPATPRPSMRAVGLVTRASPTAVIAEARKKATKAKKKRKTKKKRATEVEKKKAKWLRISYNFIFIVVLIFVILRIINGSLSLPIPGLNVALGDEILRLNLDFLVSINGHSRKPTNLNNKKGITKGAA